MLYNYLVLFGAILGGANRIFKQENTSLKQRMLKKINNILLQQNPDLNLMENFWSYIMSQIYTVNKQFLSAIEIEEATVKEQHNISES